VKNSLRNAPALLLLLVVFGAAAGQAAPKTQPNAAARNAVPDADRRYNAAVDGFNKATQAYSAVKPGDTQALAQADTLLTDNVAQMQALTQDPALRADANVPRLHSLLGYSLLLLGNPTGAIPELQQAVTLVPGDLNARNNLGNALRETQQYDQAATQYQYIVDRESAGTSGPDSARVRFNLATALGQAGKNDAALAVFSQIAPTGDAATLKNYGFFLQKAGRNAEAADALRQSAEKNPQDAVSWLDAGELYAKVGRQDAAIAALTRAVGPDVDPKLDAAGQYDAHFTLGEMDAAKSDTNNAIREFDAASAVQPDNGVPLYNKGVLQEQAGQRADAEVSYRAALAKTPDSVQTQTALGLLLADGPNAAEATGLLAQAAPKLPQDSDADKLKAAPVYARLGDLYATQRSYAQADAARQQAVALNPSDADTRVALADSYMAQKQYVSALTQYDAAAALRPRDATIQNGRGVAYKALRQYPKALAAFRQALARDPRNAQVQNNVGVLYELLGSKAQAIVAYKKALALNPDLAVARTNLARFARRP